jgi:DNA gyrase/topoisomerase IV subunit A
MSKINQPAPGNISWRLLGYIIVVMIATSMYSCKSNNTPAAQTTQMVQNNDSANAAHDSLVSQFGAARLQIDGLTTRTAMLDSQIREKDAEISKLKKEVSHLGKKNKALAAKLKKDERFINSLKDELSEKARSFAEKLGLLQTDKDYLTKERDSFMARYAALKELGSVLHVSDFRLEPIHLKRHGKKEKETERARRVDELRIYFDIDENRIADDGIKQLYVVITDPGGKLLNNAANKSGAITTNSGKSVSYSIVKEIALKKNEPVKDVTVDWKQDDDYKRGVYTISIYNSGYRVGGGNVTLR